MHELSIAQSIMEIVQSNVPAGRGNLVRSVRVRIGRVSGVVPESLDFCFTAITHNTPLSGAALDIEAVPFMLHCRVCKKSFEGEMGVVVCPECGGTDTEVLSGFDLQVVSIELDDEPPPGAETVHESVNDRARGQGG